MSRLLHVLNGDATRAKLEASTVPGTLTVWADVLHDGPCRLVPPDEWRRLRSRFLGSQGFLSEDQILAQYEAWDRQLAACAEYDEVVFWLEHDLFDQLLLIRHLHWLASLDPGATRFSMICIGAFPGVPEFVGLGQLGPEQLASLLAARQPISKLEIEIGSRAWERFCAPDPSGLVALLGEDTAALPFLDSALRRFLADYPALGNGLSRSEAQILRAVEAGASTASAAFRATQTMEERIFRGDWSWWSIVRALASGSDPLVEIDGDRPEGFPARAQLRVTDPGRRVLAGDADRIVLDGIDRWMAGVHLTDGRRRWTGRTIVTR